MNTLLKSARESKGITMRELARLSNIDQALISKFETGTRTPTFDQLLCLTELLDLEKEKIQVLWLKSKILKEVDGHPFAIQALKAAEEALSGTPQQSDISSASIQKLMDEMESLKSMLSKR